MRKTFVVGKLAGSTARILLLEDITSRSTPPMQTVDPSRSAPTAKAADSSTVH